MKLTWDESGKRLYETGVDHVVLFLQKDDGEYEYGVAWNGITGVTESPDGADANDIYADNIKYLSLISAENWKGTIKAYTFPEIFNECQGQYEYDDGVIDGVYFGQQDRRRFGIAWRSIVGNDTVGNAYGYKLHIAYGLSAAPSEMDHATVNDSPEAQEMSWEINSIPEIAKTATLDDGEVPGPVSHVVIESNGNAGVYKAVEDVLIGTNDDSEEETTGTNPRLPKLDELIGIIKTAVNS